MSDPKDFVAGMDSNARKSPKRIVFVTRRTSAQVKVATEDQVQTYPEVLFRAIVAIELLTIVLVGVALLFNAPLEGLADPSHTPNPAKAPWYFLGLQEMLHYFPPVVAGVLVPTLVVIALIVIPYFNINIEADGLFLKDRKRRVLIFYALSPPFPCFWSFLTCMWRWFRLLLLRDSCCWRFKVLRNLPPPSAVIWLRNRFHSGS